MAGVRTLKAAVAVGLETADFSGHRLRAGLVISTAKSRTFLDPDDKADPPKSVQVIRESVGDAELRQDNIADRAM